MAAVDGSIIIDTKGDASGFNKMVDNMSGSLKKFIALAASAFSVAAIVGFVKESKAEYDELATAQMKLTTVMRNSIQARDDEIRSIMGLISAQEELGVVSDDAQTAGAQELGTYLSLTSSLKTLIPVMNDMVAQQLGIGASGESVVTIATMLGKVMEGQTGALSRYGYSFDAAQEKILKTGTEMERAAVLAEVVSASVGGMNEALAQTDAGRQYQLAQAFNEVKAQFGAAFSQISTLFIPALQTVAKGLSVVANLARQAAQYIAMMFGKKLTTGSDAAGSSALAAASGSAVAAKSYDSMAESATNAAASEKSLAAATKEAGKAAEKALAPFDDLNVLQQETADTGSGSSGGGSDFGDIIGGIGSGVIGIAEDVEMTGPFMEFMERLRGLLEPLSKIDLTNLKDSFGKFVEALKGVGGTVLDNLKWLWEKFLVPLAKWTIEKALPKFLTAVTEGLKALTPVIKAFKTSGEWLFDNFLEPMGEIAGDAIVWILDAIGNAFEKLGLLAGQNQGDLDKTAKLISSIALGIVSVVAAAALVGKIVSFFKALGSSILGFANLMIAHPVIAILGLLAGAVIYIIATMNEANSKIKPIEVSASVQDAISKLQSVQDEVKNIKDDYALTTVQIKIDYTKAEGLADELEALQALPSLGEAETARIKEITDQLVAIYPELKGYVGKDGLIKQEADEVRTLITEYANLNQQKAYDKMVAGMQEQYAEALAALTLLEGLEKHYHEELSALNEKKAALLEAINLSTTDSEGTREQAMLEKLIAIRDAMGGFEELAALGIDLSGIFDTSGALLSLEEFQSNAEATDALVRVLGEGFWFLSDHLDTVSEAEAQASADLIATREAIADQQEPVRQLGNAYEAAAKQQAGMVENTDGTVGALTSEKEAIDETSDSLVTLKENTGDVGESLGEATDDAATAEEDLKTKAKTITDLAAEIKTGTEEGIKAQEALSEAKTAVSTDTAAILLTMETFMTALETDVAAMFATMVEIANDPEEHAATAGTNFTKNIGTGIKDKPANATVKKESTSVITGAVTAANTAINDKTSGAQSAGKNFDAGVAKGIADNVQLVKDAAKSLAQELIKSFNFTMQIKSPSNVGEKAGGFTVAGVAKGILGSIGMAVKAVSTLGNSIRDAMGNIDLVPDGFSSQISNAFKLASPTLPVPAMASGTIMTQGARMMQAASPAYAGMSGGWSDDEQGLREMIREEVGDIVGNVKIYFAGRGSRLARALTPELDRESKRKGMKLVEGDA